MSVLDMLAVTVMILLTIMTVVILNQKKQIEALQEAIKQQVLSANQTAVRLTDIEVHLREVEADARAAIEQRGSNYG